jgi:hypothetical protein
MNNWLDRVGHAVLGAFLGFFISVLPLAWLSYFLESWNFFVIGSISCTALVAILAAVLGERFVTLMRDLLVPWG